MDITLNKKPRCTNSFMNGETVNYIISGIASFLTLITFKQFFKTFIGIEATAACFIGFAAAEIVLFLLEKFFVYRSNALGSTIKEIIYSVINASVHLGIFGAVSMVVKAAGMYSFFAWLLSFFIILILNYAVSRILIFDCYSPAKSFINGRIYKLFFRNRFVVLSMAVSSVLILFAFLIFHVFPFGDTTVLRMDLYHQYGPLFVELFDRVTQHKSFLYSWTSGGGSSFLGNYFNYLSSPFSAIIFLFDRDEMPFAITTIVAAKCVASSGTFTFYLKKSLNRHSAAASVFGIFYAFSAYFLAYFWNVMWLDGMIILPLIALGIENIINRGKCRLYIFSLIYILYASYYIGYMICIFSVIYFIAYYFISESQAKFIDESFTASKKISLKKFFNYRIVNRAFKFAFSSLLAGMICAVFLIPVYFILSGSSATSDHFPKAFETYFTLFDFIETHFANLETTIRSSGNDVLPNVYCSVFTLLLVPLFIINKDIRFKEKAVYVFLIALFLFSFNTNYANFIWHALHFPNDLPYRFSFMYSFILLIMAFKALMKIKSIGIKEIGIIGMLWIAVIAVADELPTEKIDAAAVYTTLAFVIVWTAVLFIIKKKAFSKFVASVLIIAAAFCEVIIADPAAFNFNQKQGGYMQNYDKYTAAVEYINNTDESDFRTELCYLNTRMDPCLYGYDGISIFSSMAYEDYSRLQYNLGMYGNRINSYTYNTQTPVYNMMYNIKYLIYKDEQTRPSTDLYTKYYETENAEAVVFQNDYFLPKAFCVNSAVDVWSTAEGNPFEVQADFFALATGYSGVFSEAEYKNTSYTGIAGEEIEQSGTQWITKLGENSYASADITLSPVTDGNLYLYISAEDINNITVTSGEVPNSFNIETPHILDLGYFNAGDHVSVSLDCAPLSPGESSYEIYAYSVDKNILDAGYAELRKGALNVTKHSDTKIEGTVYSDGNNILYSSIPYDEGWSIYIDGEKAEAIKIGNCQLGAMIKPGEHTIEYIYKPKGIAAGAIISSAALLCSAGWFMYCRRKKKCK